MSHNRKGERFELEPLVTLAIASYNNATYIERCINNALRQTYTNVEILVIDDGSTDSTDSIIETNYSNTVKYIKKENGGLSTSRELALNTAKGEYICFIDADDYCSNEYIKHMTQKMITSNADICVCGTVFLDMNGKEIKEFSDAFCYLKEIPPTRIDNDLLAEQFSELNRIYKTSDSWNKIYKRSFILKSDVHFLTPKGLNGTDSSFNKRILLHNPVIATIATNEYYHVIYNNSAVHRKNKKQQIAMQVLYDQLMEEAKKVGNYALLYHQLISVYYGALRDSFEDVYNENKGNYKALYAEFLKIIDSHSKYTSSRNISNNTDNTFSKSINLFIRCVESKNVWRVMLHIRMRRILISLWEKSLM